MLQGLPVEELHRYERLTVVFANFIDRANVGMVQGLKQLVPHGRSGSAFVSLARIRQEGTSGQRSDAAWRLLLYRQRPCHHRRVFR
jgi:hypothetical protein